MISLRRLKRRLQAEVCRDQEPTEPTEAQEAVEKSRLALKEVAAQTKEAKQVAQDVRRIGERNGFGRLAEQMFEKERARRRRLHVGGSS